MITILLEGEESQIKALFKLKTNHMEITVATSPRRKMEASERPSWPFLMWGGSHSMWLNPSGKEEDTSLAGFSSHIA